MSVVQESGQRITQLRHVSRCSRRFVADDSIHLDDSVGHARGHRENGLSEFDVMSLKLGTILLGALRHVTDFDAKGLSCFFQEVLRPIRVLVDLNEAFEPAL